MSSEFWNERYAGHDLVYGEKPNDFLAAMKDRFPPAGPTPGPGRGRGRALDIAAGEGRNALYLASLGFETVAMDQSEVGMHKALRLAKERGLALRTVVADLNDFDAEPGSFGVISSTFVHLPAPLRARVHRGVARWLRPGGVYVLEAYGPEQIRRDTGGPKDPLLLAPLETIVEELTVGNGTGGGLTIEHRAALVRDVVEGTKFHGGAADVVQVVARKT